LESKVMWLQKMTNWCKNWSLAYLWWLKTCRRKEVLFNEH